MRESKRDPLRILHIHEAIQNINEFMNGKSLDDVKNDKLLFYAVVKNIEIIGEAAFMLTKDFKSEHSHIPWTQIIGMRHVLVHEYFHISPLQVFKVYKEDLPKLKDWLKDLSSPS